MTDLLTVKETATRLHCVGFVPEIDPKPVFIPLKSALGLGLLGYVALMGAILGGGW